MRVLGILKRTGVVGAIAVLTMWTTSVVYAFAYDTNRFSVVMAAGIINGFYIEGEPEECLLFNSYRRLGWMMWSERPEFNWTGEFGLKFPHALPPLTYSKFAVTIHRFELPFWIPFCIFLLIALAGLLLDRRSRQVKCPNCGCGTGAAQDPCRKCGLQAEESLQNSTGRKRRKPLRTLYTAFTVYAVLLFLSDEFDLFVVHSPRGTTVSPAWLPVAGLLIIVNLLWYFIDGRVARGRSV